MKKSFVADDYFRAFCIIFEDADACKLECKQVNDLFVVEYKGESFVIAHYTDLYESLRSYFDGERYDKLLQMPVQLWDELVKNELESLSNTDWLTRLYHEWKSYWERNKPVKGDLIYYMQERENSWKELQVLFTALSLDGSASLTKAACRVNDKVLIPIIALAIKAHYTTDFYEEFLSDCILALTEKCQVYISGGGKFDCVVLDDLDSKPFFVYSLNVN